MLVVVGLVLALFTGRSSAEPVRVRITFLALAHGEATLVQAPGGFRFLAGGGSAEDVPALLRELSQRGVTRLHCLLQAAWAPQHVGGLPALLDRLPVEAYVTGPMHVSTPAGDHAQRLASGLATFGKLRLVQTNPGEVMTFFRSPSCRLISVGPVGSMFQRFRNDPRCSMTYEINFEGVSFLYLGEGGPEHHALLWKEAREKPWGHVLQVGRAGGEGSVPGGLLKELRTRVAVIPVPRKGKARPAASTIAILKKAGVRTLRTDRDGTIVVELSPTGIQSVKTRQ